MSGISSNNKLHGPTLAAPISEAYTAELLTLTGELAAHASANALWPDFMVGQKERPTRVVLVDDDPHIRRVIGQEFTNDSRILLVAQAACVREARRVIRQHAFDVMVVDIRLGDGEGY